MCQKKAQNWVCYHICYCQSDKLCDRFQDTDIHPPTFSSTYFYNIFWGYTCIYISISSDYSGHYHRTPHFLHHRSTPPINIIRISVFTNEWIWLQDLHFSAQGKKILENFQMQSSEHKIPVEMSHKYHYLFLCNLRFNSSLNFKNTHTHRMETDIWSSVQMLLQNK